MTMERAMLGVLCAKKNQSQRHSMQAEVAMATSSGNGSSDHEPVDDRQEYQRLVVKDWAEEATTLRAIGPEEPVSLATATEGESRGKVLRYSLFPTLCGQNRTTGTWT
ncbi:unnamed protein product, partial [Iphiclides podalirius]